MFLCTVWIVVWYFITYRKLYACVYEDWAWRTKSIGFWDVLGFGHEWGVVMGGPHAERGLFSSPEVLRLGWMSEGVHFMLNLGMLWARESVKQDYKRGRLVGWTTSEEGRGSTWNPRFRVHARTHIGYEWGKEGILKINKWTLMFRLGLNFILFMIFA